MMTNIFNRMLAICLAALLSAAGASTAKAEDDEARFTLTARGLGEIKPRKAITAELVRGIYPEFQIRVRRSAGPRRAIRRIIGFDGGRRAFVIDVLDGRLRSIVVMSRRFRDINGVRIGTTYKEAPLGSAKRCYTIVSRRPAVACPSHSSERIQYIFDSHNSVPEETSKIIRIRLN
ncbi:MAG: DUF1131 family protein [Neomegalonema sp.]|nr:DUF1131 family protein [Neomegalonema sp.]